MNSYARKLTRRGVTLIELLIVVSIMVLLMAYATSMIKPALEDRKNREAAQLVNTYFTAAQARAAEKGRPEGVWLERSPNDDNKVLQMFAATSPPPFMGSLTTSRVNGDVTLSGTPPPPQRYSFSDIDPMIDPWRQGTGFDTTGNGTADVNWMGRVFLDEDGGNGSPDSFVAYPLIRPGDQIKFNFQGAVYRIVRVKPLPTFSAPFPRGVESSLANGEIHIAPAVNDFLLSKPSISLRNLPFQIFRQPKKSIVASVEFPTGISLDLALSGFGYGGKELEAGDPDDTNATVSDPVDGDTYNPVDDRTPVVIMFRPTGGVDRVYHHNTSIRPVEPLHLLLGQYEYSYADRLLQVNDDRNRWLTISHRSGDTSAVQVKIDENNPLTDLSDLSIRKSRANALSARRAAAVGTGG